MNIEKIKNKIIHGNSLDILKKIPENSVDLVFADPPYNLHLSKILLRPDQTKVDGVKENWDNFDSFSNLSSGTSTIPILGSIVQNGKLAASAFLEAVRALKSVDFPTFGKPTIPHLNPI